MSDFDTNLPPHRVDQLICFALYSANNAMNKAYKQYISPMNLTYPQYITLTSLWEKDGVTVGALCSELLSETSTLTPVIKRLENLGYVQRVRGIEDERQVFVHLTEKGNAMRKHAPKVTSCVIEDTGLGLEKLNALVESLSSMRDNLLNAPEKG